MNISERYLKFIGFTSTPKADLNTLRELHKLHTLMFPFENLTPFLHKEVILNSEILIDKFTEQGRGGYCFEQNLLFSDVLKELGFKVKGLGARVLWNQPEDLITRRSHMLLIVTIDEMDYLADVGFGGLTLTTPLKFVVGLEQQTTHEIFRIGKLGDDLKVEAKVNDVWKTLYRFDLTVQHPIDYEVANFYLYTNTESIFRNNLIAGQPSENGRHALSNDQYTFYPMNEEPQRKILKSRQEIKDVLKDVFRIEVPKEDLLEQKLDKILDLRKTQA